MRTAFLLSMIAFCQFSIPAQGDDTTTGEIDGSANAVVLEMIVTEILSNQAKLLTFEGIYDFEDCFRFPGEIPKDEAGDAPSIEDLELDRFVNAGVGKQVECRCYWEVTRGSTEVQLNFEHDLLHATYTPDENVVFLDSMGRVHRWSTNGDENIWILTPEHVLVFQPHVEIGQAPGHPPTEWIDSSGGRIAYRRSTDEGRAATRVFDPREFFSNGSMPYHET